MDPKSTLELISRCAEVLPCPTNDLPPRLSPSDAQIPSASSQAHVYPLHELLARDRIYTRLYT